MSAGRETPADDSGSALADAEEGLGLAAALGLLAAERDPERARLLLVRLQRDLTGARVAIWYDHSDRGVSLAFQDPPGEPPWWAERASRLVEATLQSGEARFEPLASDAGPDAPAPTLVVQPVPFRHGGAAVALEVETPNSFVLALTHERLALSARAASVLTDATHASADPAAPSSARGTDEICDAIALAAAANGESSFAAAANAYCNEAHTRLAATRVSLGRVIDDRARVVCVSRTRDFDREVKTVRALESAMAELASEEGLAFDPAHPPAGSVLRSFAEQSGPAAVVAMALLPGHADGMVVLIERDPARPFEPRELEMLRLSAELCAGPLLRLARADEPPLERFRRSVRDGMATLVEPRHTGRKLAIAAGVLALSFVALVPTTFEVESPAVIEAVERRVLTAPFDGELSQAGLEPGADVIGGETLIAALDTRELDLELSRARAESRRFRTEADVARGRGDPARAEVARLAARRAEARITLLESRIAEARIVAPVTGVLIAGDLQRRLGGAVRRGEVLAEVAPLDELRGDVFVSESDVHELEVGQRGRLRTAASPGLEIPIEVLRIDPVAQVREGTNRFRVLVEVESVGQRLLPGSQGIARIEVGRAPRLRIWTRRLVGTLRLWLWL